MKKYTITQFRKDFPDDDACLDRIFQIRFTDLVCPKCSGIKPYSRVKGRRSYQCPDCSFQLYPTKDTVFEKSTTPLTHWFYAIFLQTTTRNGVAAKELERQLSVCYKTALRMSHQIKKLMASYTMHPLQGVVSADESLIGGLSKNRHADKRTNSRGRSLKEKIPVFGMMGHGRVMAFVVPDVSGFTLIDKIKYCVRPGWSVMVTDQWSGYKYLHQHFPHVIINHSEGEYGRGAFSTNNMENFWSILKRTIKGTHVHVSRQHLQKYVDEVAFRFMHRGKQDQMFNTILSQMVWQPSL